MEALIVGVQQIVEGTAGKKFAQREILIFTDGGMTFQENSQMRGIVEVRWRAMRFLPSSEVSLTPGNVSMCSFVTRDSLVGAWCGRRPVRARCTTCHFPFPGPPTKTLSYIY